MDVEPAQTNGDQRAGNGRSEARPADNAGLDTDVVVVGSGFGGSVAALRLSEKGYRVTVIEAGRRFTPDTFPKTSWDLRRFLWAPFIGCRGLQRIYWLKDVVVLSGAGVGGGSLVYANTLYEPLAEFYDDPQWSHITDWADELAPHYDQAKRMLGVEVNKTVTPADEVMKAVATEMGVGDSFHMAPVGVYFGEPGKRVPDPYFGGAGPDRVGCIECGACMTGCRHEAKNSLDTNYLYLAEKLGAKIRPDTTVEAVKPRRGGGYDVIVRPTGPLGRFPWQRRRITTGQVVFAAGALGTQRLLHRLKDAGDLPRLSDRLGVLTRTNSEAIVGAVARPGGPVDYTRGVAITSSFHPDAHTHIEPVRYGRGSNSMGLMSTIMTDGGPGGPRVWKWLKAAASNPRDLARSLSVRRWSERTVVALTMQSLDNSLTLYRRHLGPLRYLASRQGHGVPNPTWIPAGNEASRLMAKKMKGDPRASWPEVFNVPLTAHIIGGCAIGDSPETGVIDPYQRMYGHPGLHVVDGAAVSANLGVNPSLTITAQAERAMSLWPNRDEDDPRPPLGEPYRRIDPVPPVTPAVPAHASGALRLRPRRASAATE